MISDGNDGSLIVGDDIDWTFIDCTHEDEITCDEKCDIEELLGSIEFVDYICPDLEHHESSSSWNDLLFVTSVGQPTCEKKDKAILESSFTDIISDSAESCVGVKIRPSKKIRNLAIGPSNRQSKKKIKGLPKRPLSAYNLFFQSERLKIFEEGLMNHERISFQGLAKLVGQRWQVLDEETRQELRHRSQQDIIRYQKEMKEYREKHFIDPGSRKRSPPNSPRSSKSVLKLPMSSKQKIHFSESSSNTNIDSPAMESGQVKSDSPLTEEKGHTMGKSLVRHKTMDLEHFSNRKLYPTTCQAKMERSEHVSESGDQCRLVCLYDPFGPVMSYPTPLHLFDHTLSSSASETQYNAGFQSTRAVQTVPTACPPPSGDCLGIDHKSSMNFSNPSQTNQFSPASQYPMSFAVSARRSHVNTLPAGKEVQVYDSRTGSRFPYKIEYKCFAMTRSEANAYVARYSYPGVNGSHYVPLENMLRALPPPGVEVQIPRSKTS
jgi:HMG (high mobility group) box